MLYHFLHCCSRERLSVGAFIVRREEPHAIVVISDQRLIWRESLVYIGAGLVRLMLHHARSFVPCGLVASRVSRSRFLAKKSTPNLSLSSQHRIEYDKRGNGRAKVW